MSFRDLRNFTETMRVLGYPRLISVSNFRSPNFPLVAEILAWLVARFEPDVDLSVDLETEEQRVAMIRTVAEFMALKTSVKLNTKKLYQADGYAVKELLKIATLLVEAQRASQANVRPLSQNRFDLTNQGARLKATRQLASLLTSTGAALFDSLAREAEFREIRGSRLAKQLDVPELEAGLAEASQSVRREIEETNNQIENVKETEQNMAARIDRRKSELDRNRKRLQTLRKVRPAFMEEFEKLESELRELYEEYLQKFRYLAYLEHLYEESARTEQERFETRQAATRRQLEKMRADEIGFDADHVDSILPPNLEEPLAGTEIEKNREKSGPMKTEPTGRSSRMTVRQRRVYGSMSGRRRGSHQESNDSGSMDTDSELLIDGDLDDESLDDDDDDDIFDEAQGPLKDFQPKASQDKPGVARVDHSDEDF